MSRMKDVSLLCLYGKQQRLFERRGKQTVWRQTFAPFAHLSRFDGGGNQRIQISQYK